MYDDWDGSAAIGDKVRRLGLRSGDWAYLTCSAAEMRQTTTRRRPENPTGSQNKYFARSTFAKITSRCF